MSATGFHPDPSAKAPWTRTMVLTAAYAGDKAAKATPGRRARIKRFMVQLRFIEVDRARTCRQRIRLSDFARSRTCRSIASEQLHCIRGGPRCAPSEIR